MPGRILDLQNTMLPARKSVGVGAMAAKIAGSPTSGTSVSSDTTITGCPMTSGRASRGGDGIRVDHIATGSLDHRRQAKGCRQVPQRRHPAQTTAERSMVMDPIVERDDNRLCASIRKEIGQRTAIGQNAGGLDTAPQQRFNQLEQAQICAAAAKGADEANLHLLRTVGTCRGSDFTGSCLQPATNRLARRRSRVSETLPGGLLPTTGRCIIATTWRRGHGGPAGSIDS